MKNQKLTNFADFKNQFLDQKDNNVKVFKFFYNYNDSIGYISDEDIDDCRQAEFIEKARAGSVFFGVGTMMWTLDKTIFKHRRMSPVKFILSYAFLPSLSFQITKNYFCKDVEQTFHDMAEKYKFSLDQYHQAMELITQEEIVNKLDQLEENRLMKQKNEKEK